MINKKGVSSVILSSILILIVIVLVALIAITMKSLTTSVNEGVIKTQCDLENPDNLEAAQNCILAKMGKDVAKEDIKEDKKEQVKDYSSSNTGYVISEGKEEFGSEILRYYEDKTYEFENEGYIVEFFESPISEIENVERAKAEKLKEEGRRIDASLVLDSIESLKNHQKEKIKNERIVAISDIKQRLGKLEVSKDKRDQTNLRIVNEYEYLINAVQLDIDLNELEKIKGSSHIKNIYPNKKYEISLDDSVSVINGNNNYENGISGLVLWLKGEDNANDSVAYKNGVLKNGISFAPGIDGKAFHFDGVDDYIEIPYSQSLNNDQYTLSFWMKSPGDLALQDWGIRGVIEKSDFNIILSDSYKNMQLGDGIQRMSLWIDGGYYTNNNWHHIVMSRDAGKVYLYVDGVKRSTSNRFSNFYDSNSGINIGKWINYYFSGDMDEIMLYNRALNQAEINKLYNKENFGNKYTGRNVSIAIVDTGVDYTHPDLGLCSSVKYTSIEGNLNDYYLETPHPLPTTGYIEWNISMEGFSNMSIHFVNLSTKYLNTSPTGYVSSSIYLNMYNRNGNNIGSYVGDYSDFWTNPIAGDFVRLRFYVDPARPDYKYYGFIIDKILNGSVTYGINFSNCPKVISGWDFVNNDADPMDDHGHGTHVAATAAGNGILKGVAPDAKIMAYKVLSSSGSGNMANVISAIENATLSGADIISMSLGANCGGTYNSNCGPDDLTSKAVDNAVNSGVSVVVAAGNSGPNSATIGSPGTARGAITVGASYKKNYNGSYWLDVNPKKNQITSFSSRGPVIVNGLYSSKPDVVAPGALICAAQWANAWSSSECIDNEHTAISGTSMATPHVAGGVAIIKEAHPDWSPLKIKSSLMYGATDLKYNHEIQGVGLINLDNSLKMKGELMMLGLNLSVPFLGNNSFRGYAYGVDFANYSIYASQNDGQSFELLYYSNVSSQNFEYYLDSSRYEDKVGIVLKLLVFNIYGEKFETRARFVPDNIAFNRIYYTFFNKIGDTIIINGSLTGKIDDFDIYYKRELNGTWENAGVTKGVLNQNGEIINGIIGYIDSSNFENGLYFFNVSVRSKYRNSSEVSPYTLNFHNKLINIIPFKIEFQNGYSGSVPYAGISLEDINGDSIKELVHLEFHVSNRDYGTSNRYMLHVLDTQGNELTGWPKLIISPSLVNISDLDNDGDKEFIMYASNSGNRELYVYDHLGNLIFNKPSPENPFNYTGTILGNSTRGFSYSPSAFDLDNDGKKEIVTSFYYWASVPINEASIQNKYSGIAIYNISGDMVNVIKSSNNYTGSLSSGDCPFIVSDLDNDGKKEIIIYQIYGTYCMERPIRVLNYSGSEVTNFSQSQDKVYNSISIMALDINKDGKKEIVSIIVNKFGSFFLRAYDNNGVVLWNISNNPNPTKIYSTDLDLDGYPEINAVRITTKVDPVMYVSIPTTNVSVFDRYGNFMNYNLYLPGNSINIMSVGDTNGDNKPDVLLRASNITYTGYFEQYNQTYSKVGLINGLPSMAYVGFASVEDLDRDGVAELVQFSDLYQGASYLNVWNLSTQYNPALSYRTITS